MAVQTPEPLPQSLHNDDGEMMFRRSLLLLALLPALAAAQTITVQIRPLSPTPGDTTDHIDLGYGTPGTTDHTGILVAVVHNRATGALMLGQRVTWTTGNANIASISGSTANGLAVAEGYGVTSISATVAGVTATTTACVFGKNAPYKVIVLGPGAPDTNNVIPAKSTAHFAAYDQNGNAFPPTCVHWTVDNVATAMIDRRGNVLGITPNKTRVNAFLGVMARP